MGTCGQGRAANFGGDRAFQSGVCSLPVEVSGSRRDTAKGALKFRGSHSNHQGTTSRALDVGSLDHIVIYTVQAARTDSG